jgi:hypothetical protein
MNGDCRKWAEIPPLSLPRLFIAFGLEVAQKAAMMVHFNRRKGLEFPGNRITSDAGQISLNVSE